MRWYIDFNSGADGADGKGQERHVRLVRGGQAIGPFERHRPRLVGRRPTTTCLPAVGYPGQDASYGRDATQDNDADGHAGFAFTKLDANGNALPASAAAGPACATTSPAWSGRSRPTTAGLRDKDWTYTWYNPDPATNGGSAGTPDGTDNCYDPARCDTAKFVADVNQAGLCGARDWRLPTRGGTALHRRLQPL